MLHKDLYQTVLFITMVFRVRFGFLTIYLNGTVHSPLYTVTGFQSVHVRWSCDHQIGQIVMVCSWWYVALVSSNMQTTSNICA